MKKNKVILVVLFIIFSIPVYSKNRVNFAKAPIIKANLFKNGLALISRKIIISPNKSILYIKDNPMPIHGTFWTNYGGKAEITFTQMDVLDQKKKDSSEILSIKEIFKSIVGKKVKIFFGGKEFVIGKVKAFKSKFYQYIVLDTNKGLEFIHIKKIDRFLVLDKNINLKKEAFQPALIKKNIFKIKVIPSNKKRVFIFSYLTKGLTWIPSYKLNLLNKKEANLSLKAVIKNELMDIKKAQFYLISGFPAIKYKNVTAPLSNHVSINNFFNQLSRKDNSYRYRREITQNIAYQSRSSFSDSRNSSDKSELSTSDYDIHFQKIGIISINKDEAKLIQISKEITSIENVVEWEIPNNRDYRGRYYGSSSSNKVLGNIWDAIIIKNPFIFPMTTAPITVYNKNNLYSQNISYWIAPGEKNSIKFTKALNLKTNHTESEVKGKRKKIKILGNDYQKSIVEGTITIKNLRKNKQKVIIKRKFIGKLIKANKNPKKRLLPEGVYNINEKNELIWNINLEGGQEIKVNYKYSILIDV